MNFDQLSTAVVHFLPELHDLLGRILLLDIARFPALPADDLIPITPATTGKFLPVAELSRVLVACAHLLRRTAQTAIVQQNQTGLYGKESTITT